MRRKTEVSCAADRQAFKILQQLKFPTAVEIWTRQKNNLSFAMSFKIFLLLKSITDIGSNLGAG